MKNRFREKIDKSHKEIFCTPTPINHTTQEEEVEVGIVVEETEEKGVEEPTHKQEAKERRSTLKLRVTIVRKKYYFASFYPEKNQDDHDLNKADIEEADIALYMHEIVFLNEDKVIPKTLEQSKREDGMWYLDNGASNHMTGERSYFSELNESIKGKVKFGDGSCVDINDKGSMLFEAKTGEHRFLTDIYYIPDLKSNILSLVQATEQG